MNKEFDFLNRTPTPQLFFREMVEGHEYKIQIIDLHNPVMSRTYKNTSYFYYLCKILEGFEGIAYDKDLSYKIHFPLRMFEIAWEKAPSFQVFNGEPTSCLIKYVRVNKTTLKILEREYLVLGG